MNDIRASWERMAEADMAFQNALTQFVKGDRETRISTLREGLKSARGLTIKVLRWVPIDERKELLPDLMYYARAVSGYIGHFRELILSLPKEWLLQHIEGIAEPLLQAGDDQEYRRFLELYIQIDPGLTKRLAQRALASSDPNVREAGQDFLEKLA